MKIIVIAARSQLGTDLIKAANERKIGVAGFSSDQVDVTKTESVRNAIDAHKPDVVINCAAFHQLENCEQEPAKTFEVNAIGSLNVARIASSSGVKSVFISTNYVFSGDKEPPDDYKETDTPKPLSVYATSKLAGEALVLQTDPRALVVRSASLFGVAGSQGKGGNFIDLILKKAKEDGKLRVVGDQWMTPTYTKDLANAILDLVQKNISGLIHVTNKGACTWYQFASEILERIGLKVPVEKISYLEYHTHVKRPTNSILNTDYLESLGIHMPTWQESLYAYLREKGHFTPGGAD